MNLIVRKQNFFYFVWVSILTSAGYILIKSRIAGLGASLNTLSICMLITLAIFTIEFILLYRITGELLDYFNIFLVSFIIFHFGCFIVYSFNYAGDYFYLRRYEPEFVISTFEYQYLCTQMLFLAASFKDSINPFRFNSVNLFEPDSVYRIARNGLILSGIITVPITGLKLVTYVLGNYKAVIALNESLPPYLTIVTYFFVPFCVLMLVYAGERKKTLLNFILVGYSLAITMTGDRTVGLGGIVIFAIIDSKSSNKTRMKQYLGLVVAAFVVGILIVYVRAVREGGSFNAMSITNIIAEVLAELGSSYFPLLLIMRVCPSNHGFLLGKSYFYSIVSGFLPASIDPTGTIRLWNKYAVEPLKWIENDYDYNFGTGLSLCAEAYANFSWFGIIALFIIALILIKLLKNREDNQFSQYTSLILLYEFFTLPRRNFYYIVNHASYCIIFVLLFILLFGRKQASYCE